VRNITLSIDEEVLIAVRRYAAEQNSSVNALMREYLTNVARHENGASLGAHTVYSEDLNDGQQYGPVQVINPFR
jgi:hypothetical protein